MFQVEGILQSLARLTQTYGSGHDAVLAGLREELDTLEPEADLYCGNAHLVDLLYRIKKASADLSEQLSVQFFSHTGAAEKP